MSKMNVTLFIISLVLVPASASFFDVFRGAMASVEDSFEKLLGDVVTDVKQTIHCTIMAVEQVLSISGILSDPSNYNQVCNPNIPEVSAPKYDRSYIIHDAYSVTSPPQQISAATGNTKNQLTKQLDHSISTVNKTLFKIIQAHDAKNKLENIKKVLTNETERLNEVSALLRTELLNIKTGVTNKIKNMEPATPSIENVWKDIKILEDIKHNDKNISEVNEISRVLNGALNVLRTNDTTLSSESRFKEIVQNLEQETHSDSKSHVVHKAKAPETETDIIIPAMVSFSPRTFKDVAINIFGGKNEATTVQEQTIVSNIPDKGTVIDGIPKPGDESVLSISDGLHDLNLFEFPSHTSDNPKAIEDVKSIIEESQNTEAFFNDLYKNIDTDSAKNVFDNVEDFQFK